MCLFLEKFTFVRETVLCWVFTLFKTARQGMGGVEELGNEVRRSQLGIKREQDLSFSPFFFVLSFFICNFAARLIRIIKMELQNCINTIRENSSKIVCDFGIRTLRIFGSVSRNEQTENSDLDVCVETQTPDPFLLASLKDYLESIFKCSVDVVRMHKNMNPLLKSRIERDGIYAIR